MAKERFDPEIRSSMKGGGKPRPAQMRTRPGGSQKKVAADESGSDSPPQRGAPPQLQRQPPQMQQPQPQMQPPMGGGAPDAHHVQAAAGIAHAILGRRQM